MKEESLLLLSDLQILINQVVLIDYTIIILGCEFMKKFRVGLIIWGCVGLGLGHVMFGDIGISCTYCCYFLKHLFKIIQRSKETSCHY